jgi:hypothetical protein
VFEKMKKGSTPADQQIKRLEVLRLEKDKLTQKKAAKVEETPRNAVERTIQRLDAMREMASHSGPATPPMVPMDAPAVIPTPAPVFPTPPPKAADPLPQATRRSTPSPEDILRALVEETKLIEKTKVLLPVPETVAESVPVPSPLMPIPVTTPIPSPMLERVPEPLRIVMSPPPPPLLAVTVPVAEVPVVLASAPAPPPMMPVLEETAPVAEEMVLPPDETVANEALPPSRTAFPRFDGRLKNIKLSVSQMKSLEQLFDVDPRLYPARILRLALNHWLEMSNLPEDAVLEPLSRDALMRIKKGL